MTTAPPSLDPTLHSGPRIAIVSRLMLFDVLRFAKLRDLTGLTPGNLASHLDALQKSGYVTQRDAFIAKRPGKIIGLTDRGRQAFQTYVAQLETLVAQLRDLPAARPAPPPPPAVPSRPPGSVPNIPPKQ